MEIKQQNHKQVFFEIFFVSKRIGATDKVILDFEKLTSQDKHYNEGKGESGKVQKNSFFSSGVCFFTYIIFKNSIF